MGGFHVSLWLPMLGLTAELMLAYHDHCNRIAREGYEEHVLPYESMTPDSQMSVIVAPYDSDSDDEEVVCMPPELGVEG